MKKKYILHKDMPIFCVIKESYYSFLIFFYFFYFYQFVTLTSPESWPLLESHSVNCLEILITYSQRHWPMYLTLPIPYTPFMSIYLISVSTSMIVSHIFHTEIRHKCQYVTESHSGVL